MCINAELCCVDNVGLVRDVNNGVDQKDLEVLCKGSLYLWFFMLMLSRLLFLNKFRAHFHEATDKTIFFKNEPQFRGSHIIFKALHG